MTRPAALQLRLGIANTEARHDPWPTSPQGAPARVANSIVTPLPPIARPLPRSVRRTPGLSCEAPIRSGLVSFNPLFGRTKNPSAVLALAVLLTFPRASRASTHVFEPRPAFEQPPLPRLLPDANGRFSRSLVRSFFPLPLKLASLPGRPNTGDKLRSGARVHTSRRGHEAAPSAERRLRREGWCRRKLRQLHPLVRRPRGYLAGVQ